MSDLIQITTDFGQAYTLADETKKVKEEAQRAFYQAADEALITQRLPRKTIKLPDDTDATEYVRRYHPGWRIIGPPEEVSLSSPIKIIIERDPSLMRYEFVNVEDGQTYQRTISQSQASVDVERLSEQDPELWREVSAWPTPPAWLANFITFSFTAPTAHDDGNLNDRIEAFFEERGEALGIERTLMPSAAWTDQQAARLQPYMIPGTIGVRIVPPRKATDEELEEANVQT